MKKYEYDYPMPSLTVDIVVTASEGNDVLMVTRRKDPWKGCKALPGGFVDIDETSFDAAVRELHEETGLVAEFLSFIGVYDNPGRDPRGRIVTIVYGLDCGQLRPAVKGMDDVENAEWIDRNEFYRLALEQKIAADHTTIIRDAIGWNPLDSLNPVNPRLLNHPSSFFRANFGMRRK